MPHNTTHELRLQLKEEPAAKTRLKGLQETPTALDPHLSLLTHFHHHLHPQINHHERLHHYQKDTLHLQIIKFDPPEGGAV
jgi:hypothetical protein